MLRLNFIPNSHQSSIKQRVSGPAFRAMQMMRSSDKRVGSVMTRTNRGCDWAAAILQTSGPARIGAARFD